MNRIVMNCLYFSVFLSLFLISCQKEVTTTSSIQNVSATSSDAALVPLKYHAVSFLTNYPMVSRGMPPFSCEKTLYADNRVKTIKMISRGGPINDQPFLQWNYSFTYSPNKALMVGMRKDFYYPDDEISGARVTHNIQFLFNSYGYVTDVQEILDEGGFRTVLRVTYNGKLPTDITTYPDFPDKKRYQVTTDNRGNILHIGLFQDANNLQYGNVTFTYSSKSGNNYYYQPTQWVIDQYFSFLEVMQWFPPSVNERTSITIRPPRITKVSYITQKYINHKYDANKNLTSYTYGDNVLQKITWK